MPQHSPICTMFLRNYPPPLLRLVPAPSLTLLHRQVVDHERLLPEPAQVILWASNKSMPRQGSVPTGHQRITADPRVSMNVDPNNGVAKGSTGRKS